MSAGGATATDVLSRGGDLLLPEGTRLLHIGPPKTGTTTLQGAFHATRAATEAQGVHYAGRSRHSASAVQAVTGRPGFFTGGAPPPMRHWRSLVADVSGSGAKRVVISSELLADALPESIPRIVGDLDPARVHVVVTLRPLARIIPSQWQQYVQSGMYASFDEWLDWTFNKPPGTTNPTFWRRHRHDELVARWADVVGPGNVTVIALDDADQGMVLRVFERLTGLREGTLRAQPDLLNRSMTLPEVEAVRASNIALRAEGLGPAVQSRVVHFGAAAYMKHRQPAPDEPRVETPQWALDRTAAIARTMVDAIAGSGVRVIGDLEDLARVPVSRLPADHQPIVRIPPEVAARMAMGVLLATGAAGRSRWMPEAMQFAEPSPLVRMPTSRVAGLLAKRVGAAAGRRLGRVPGRRPDLGRG